MMKQTLGGLKQQTLWEQQLAFFVAAISNQSINKHVECSGGQLGPNSCYCALTLCMHVLSVSVQSTADRSMVLPELDTAVA